MKKLNFTLLVLAALGLTACGQEPLTPLVTTLNQVMGYGQVDAQFCVAPPAPAQQYLKYLFIIDHSQSNQPGFPLVPGAVTNLDSNGSRRYGPLLNFVQNLTPSPTSTTSFGIIDFSDAASQPGNLANLQGFDSNSANFISIAQTDWIGGGSALAPQPIDGGFTNYQAALQMAYSLIQGDATTQSALKTTPIITTQYVIVFVSGGIPVVATPSSPSPTYTQTFATDISPVISQIMNLKNDPSLGPYIGDITLNTAYYYNSTQVPAAETLLQQMATAGNGLYIQFGSGQNILYQDFTPPSRNPINQLSQVFVQNENGVWWDDGNFYADSDGDGLPDLIELQLGSNPYAKDSDGNGVSDLVEYRTKGKPCDGINCSVAGRDSYSICAGYSPITAASGAVTFSSTANDGLNDCEKFLMGGLVGNFNSNNDLIPDSYAVLNTLPILPGTANMAFADPFGDGITNENKLTLGLPIQVSMKSLNNFTQRVTNMAIESQPSPQVTCYHLTVANVALSQSQNMIKVMVVQNGSTLQDKPFLQVAETPIGTNTTATFLPADFH